MAYTTIKEDVLKTPTSNATKLKVQVSFPLATGGPFKATEEPERTVGEIRQEAMQHFGVAEDPGSRYYLAGGRHGDEVADGITLAAIDEEEPGKGTIKFTLVKELIQG
jgi:hypothetical protein